MRATGSNVSSTTRKLVNLQNLAPRASFEVSFRGKGPVVLTGCRFSAFPNAFRLTVRLLGWAQAFV